MALVKINPTQWINSHIGKIYDIDGAFGIQCVDLMKIFLKDIGYPNPTRAIGGDGYADQLWYRRDALGYAPYFEYITGTLKEGDITLWAKGSPECPYSHIAMFVRDDPSNPNRGIFLGSNQGSAHSPGVLTSISCTGALGALRYKGFTKDNISSVNINNRLIEENGAMKITVDSINARLNSPTGNIVRQYKMNDIVKYQYKYIGNGHRYIVWNEGSNKIYLAVSGSETYGVEKWAEPTEVKQDSPAPSKPSTNGLTEEKGKVTFKVDHVNARKNSPTGEVVKQFMSGQSQNYDYKYVGNGHRYIVYKDGNDLIYVAVTPTEERSTEWADFGEQDSKPAEQPKPVEQPKPEEKNDDVEQPDLEPELYKPTNGWLERNGIAMAYKLVDKSNYAVKCPYVIQKAFPVVHNAGTPGDPDAATLTQSMLNAKSDNTSWHFSVDEKTIVQNLPLNRNCFAQGDFSTGWKSKNGISVEICRDMGSELFEKSELASCVLIADLLYQNGWKASDIKKHQDFDMKDANSQITHKYCLPLDETELLTPDGWVKIGDIKIGDIVAQYNNGIIEFVKVIDTVEPYQSEVIKVYKTEATANHRFLCEKNQKYFFKEWSTILGLDGTHSGYKIPHSGLIRNNGLNISDNELLLLVWVQGDGHYMYRKYKTVGKEEHLYYIGVEWHLSKKRKINRLIEILDDGNYKYSHIVQKDGTSKIRLFGKQYVEHFEKYLENKKFSWKLLEMNNYQFKLFLNELMIVDGCKANHTYCTTINQNYDVVSALCSINNQYSNITPSGNSTSLNFGTKENLWFNYKRKTEKRITDVGCVTVPSGAILIRQYGQPKIVGNCPHKTLDLGWDRYVQMVQKKYDELLAFVNPKPVEEPKDEETDDEKKTFFKLWNKLLKRVLGEK